MTGIMKAWLLTVAIFMLMMAVLPPEVVFYRWLMFTMTLAFWFIACLGIAAWILSLWAEWTDD